MRPKYSDLQSWRLLPLPEPGTPTSLRRSNLIAIAILLFVTLGMVIASFLPENGLAFATGKSPAVQSTSHH